MAHKRVDDGRGRLGEGGLPYLERRRLQRRAVAGFFGQREHGEDRLLQHRVVLDDVFAHDGPLRFVRGGCAPCKRWASRGGEPKAGRRRLDAFATPCPRSGEDSRKFLRMIS